MELQLDLLNNQLKAYSRKILVQEKEIKTYIDNNKEYERENIDLNLAVEKKNEELRIYIKV